MGRFVRVRELLVQRRLQTRDDMCQLVSEGNNVVYDHVVVDEAQGISVP